MKLSRIPSIVAVSFGVLVVAVVAAPGISGQSPNPAPNPGAEGRVRAFRAGGSHIGASVRDLEGSDLNDGGGVYVAHVESEGAAARAGLRAADIVTRFDGETVRSARQFSRLVQETPAGRPVAATIRRDGRQMNLSLTPEAGSPVRDGDFGLFIDEPRLREKLAEARERISRIPFDLDLDFDLDLNGPRAAGRARLGVSVEELTPQLAAYFGVKDGVLIASVADDSPASRAGLKAGDVIVSVNNQLISSSRDLVRLLSGVGPETEVTIAIVREKKETSLKARLDDVRARRPQRFVRPVRATPA